MASYLNNPTLLNISPGKIVVSQTDSTLDLENNILKEVDGIWLKKLNEARRKGLKIWDDPVQRIEKMHFSDNQLRLDVSKIPFSVRYPLRFMYKKLTQDKHRPYGAFVHVLLKTKDGFYVFGDTTGGKNISHRKITWIGGVLDYAQNRPRDLFDVALAEVQEETGVFINQIQKNSLFLKGFFINERHGCGFVIKVSLNITKHELIDQFATTEGTEELGRIFAVKDIESVLIDGLKTEAPEMKILAPIISDTPNLKRFMNNKE